MNNTIGEQITAHATHRHYLAECFLMHRQQQNTDHVTSYIAWYNRVSLLVSRGNSRSDDRVAILRQPLGNTGEPQSGRVLSWYQSIVQCRYPSASA